ncbi:response regulator transcription factor [Candidatus Woesebacteria bacterium]|nr:response regulator transcription factor [Candidatus Woesebacteria bacterium]
MRILVVEDEHRIANSIKKGLEQEHYAVDAVYSGNEGFDLASTEDYDVVILDLMLPGLDGITICKKLRAKAIQTAILMLTAKVALSNKEFSLLEYLMRHREQILTKEQIINHVWDYDADILPNTVEVYIRNLRRKIDFPFKGKKTLIHTIRGFGYKMAG